ncbi:MAG: hypothetical protein JOZ62_21690, partial [Acidobacteriaceae bacterium]|nr:hypothetical protein [Acidobacteriaceae bacterium]
MKVVFLLLCPVILNADSLILKSGTAVSGTYAGGDARSIRFVVGDQVKVFSINDVDRLVFESGTAVSEGRSSANSTRDRSGAEESSTVSAPAAPEKQRRFCELMQDYRAANMRYTNEPNPIKRADMRKPDPYDWEQRIVDVFGASGRFDKWTGAVRFHVDGNHIAVSFFPECEKFPQGVEFAT